jgi:hypothetical protein
LLPSSPLTTASAADPPVVPPQRLDSLDELNRRWRVTVERLTELSIELHSFGDDVPSERVALVEARLAAVRRSLVEIETSLQRLRVAAISAVAG